MHDTPTVNRISNELGKSVVLSPNDWKAVLVPIQYYFKLVYLLGAAQETGLLRSGTSLVEEMPGSQCHILTYPAQGGRPPAVVRVCSYQGYANVLTVKDLERLGACKIVKKVEITATSAMDSKGVGYLKRGEVVSVKKVVRTSGSDPRVRGCIKMKWRKCIQWISLMQPHRGYMWVRRI